jgi:hypothetical protein
MWGGVGGAGGAGVAGSANDYSCTHGDLNPFLIMREQYRTFTGKEVHAST